MLNALLTLGGLQLLTMLVLLVRTKTLAIMLGPDGVGLLAIVDKLLATVAQTVSLSLPFAAVRFLPELWSRNATEFVALARRMRNLLVLITLCATVAGLLITIISPELWGRNLLPYLMVIFVAFFSLPVVIFVPFILNVIAGRLAHNQSAVFTLGHAVVFTVSAIIGAAWGGLEVIYGLYALFGVAIVFVGMRYAVAIPGYEGGLIREKSIRLPLRVWKFTFSMWALAFLAPFVALYTHYTVLGEFGIELAGWMQAAMGVGLAVRSLLGAAHPLFLTPNVNRGGTPEERMKWVNEFQKAFSLLSIVTVLPLLLFPHFVVSVLYSAEFLPAAPYVGLFAIGELMVLLAGTYQALVVAFDHLAFHVTQNIVAQTVMLIGAVFLIKPYGILGVGIAALLAQIVLYCGTGLFLCWRYSLKLPRRNVTATLFLVLSFGLAGLTGALYPAYSWIVICGKILLYGVLVAGFTTFLTAVDRANLARAIAGISSRVRSVTARGQRL